MNIDLWQAHLTLALIVFLMLPTAKLSAGKQILVLLAALTLATLPWKGLPLSAYLRGVTDDLAITTVLWLSFACIARIRKVDYLPLPQRLQLTLFFGIIALAVYPATLGLSYFDPYRLGYTPRPLLTAAFSIALLFWFARNRVGVMMLALSTAAFALDFKNSTNYWDYIIDPMLGIYSCGFVTLTAIRKFAARSASNIATVEAVKV